MRSPTDALHMRSPTDALRMHYAPNKLQFMLEFGSECSSEIQTEGASLSQNNKIVAMQQAASRKN